MASLTEVLRIARTTRNAFNYWRRAGLLSTPFKETTAGVAGDLTRSNALEVALMASLIATGFSPKQTKKIVAEWLRAEAVGELPSIVAHLQYSPNTPDHIPLLGISDEKDIDKIAYLLGGITEKNFPEHWKDQATFGTYLIDEDAAPAPSATAFAIIRLAEIVNRVDELFPPNSDRGQA